MVVGGLKAAGQSAAASPAWRRSLPHQQANPIFFWLLPSQPLRRLLKSSLSFCLVALVQALNHSPWSTILRFVCTGPTHGAVTVRADHRPSLPAPYLTSDKNSFASVSAEDRWPKIIVSLWRPFQIITPDPARLQASTMSIVLQLMPRMKP